MRPALTALIRCLPLDAHARRVLDEALLDWSHEEQATRGAWPGLITQLKGTVGLGRAFVGVLTREFVRVPTVGLLARLFLITMVPTLLLAAHPLISLMTRPDLSSLKRFELGTLLLPPAAFLVLPVALFLVVAVPARNVRVPALGLSAAGLVAVFIVGFWAVPAANQRFRVVTLREVSHVDAATELRRGVAEESLPRLVVRALERPSSPAAGTLLFKSGWSALGAALVLLGACVSTLSPSTRRRLVVLVPVVLTLGVSPLGGSLRWGAHGHAVVGLIPWMMAFGVAIAILALGRERIDHAPNPGSQLN